MKEEPSNTIASSTYDGSHYCSTRDAANLLGVSHRTVQLWVENGVLRAWKTAGGHRRIAMASIDKLVSARQGALYVPQTSPEISQFKKVLLLDQDHELLALYENEMRHWDMSLIITKVFNGFDALIQIGEDCPDLLIVDVNMPGMDGGRVIRALRQNINCKNIAIIVISILEANEVKALGLPSNVVAFTKPMPFDRLKAAVECALEASCALQLDQNSLGIT